jgi:hypothetical protein
MGQNSAMDRIVSLQNPSAKTLNPNVVVFGDGAFGKY